MSKEIIDEEITNEMNSEDEKSILMNQEEVEEPWPASEEDPSENSQKNVDVLESQIADLKDKYLRLAAEFDNFRRRTAKENLELKKKVTADTIAAFLPVLDDFDRAKKISESPESKEVFPEGIALVHQKFHSVLQQLGVQPIECQGEVFNVEEQEAVTEVPVSDEQMKGKVVDVIEKGYKLQDKMIRYAKVIVGR